MPPLNYGNLHELLGHVLRHAFNRGHAAFNEVYEDEGLTPLQYMILELVSHNPKVTHKDIARAMGTSASVVTTTMKPLLAEGRIVRSAALRDGRMTGYVLSKEGAAWFAEIRPRIEMSERRLTDRLSDPERSELLRMLRVVAGLPGAGDLNKREE